MCLGECPNVGRFISSLGQTKLCNIPKGTNYESCGWAKKKNPVVEEPTIVELLSFDNNKVFRRWTREFDFRAFFELPDGCYEQIVE